MSIFFRKSIKTSKHTHVNMTKNGISSISVGGKNARIGIGKQGLYTSANKDGFYVREQQSWKKIFNKLGIKKKQSSTTKNNLIEKMNSKKEQIEHDIADKHIKRFCPMWLSNWFLYNFIAMAVGLVGTIATHNVIFMLLLLLIFISLFISLIIYTTKWIGSKRA